MTRQPDPAQHQILQPTVPVCSKASLSSVLQPSAVLLVFRVHHQADQLPNGLRCHQQLCCNENTCDQRPSHSISRPAVVNMTWGVECPGTPFSMGASELNPNSLFGVAQAELHLNSCVASIGRPRGRSSNVVPHGGARPLVWFRDHTVRKGNRWFGLLVLGLCYWQGEFDKVLTDVPPGWTVPLGIVVNLFCYPRARRGPLQLGSRLTDMVSLRLSFFYMLVRPSPVRGLWRLRGRVIITARPPAILTLHPLYGVQATFKRTQDATTPTWQSSRSRRVQTWTHDPFNICP